jgi:hypothetical protein
MGLVEGEAGVLNDGGFVFYHFGYNFCFNC